MERAEKYKILNTASNAVYLLVGLSMTSVVYYGWLLCASLVILALGSAYFHWNMTRASALPDEIGMYAVMVTLIGGYAGAPAAVILIGWVAFGVAAKWIPSFPVLGTLGAVLVIELAAKGQYGLMVAAMVLFSVALFARQKDNPVGHGPLHAVVWHTFTALMFLFLGLGVQQL